MVEKDKKFRIIIAGSRNFYDFKLLNKIMDKYLINLINSGISNLDVEIISGTAYGADQLGERYAKSLGINIKRFPANWAGYGKRAGYIRNEEMAKYAREETGVLFAFWDGVSRGTKHMIDLGRKYGLEVHIVKYKELDDDTRE